MLCNMAINCLAKTKRWAEAISVFERMSTDLDQPADGMTYSLVINSLALVRHGEIVMCVRSAELRRTLVIRRVQCTIVVRHRQATLHWVVVMSVSYVPPIELSGIFLSLFSEKPLGSLFSYS